MSALDKIRLAFPDLKNSSDSELLGEISKLTGTPYESAATMFGVAPRGTAAETARQIGAGFAVDLPRMVGQGLQYTGVAPETGRSLVESAQERAPGWTPDMRGRGLIGEALVTGGRAVGPMAPAIAASFVPGGQFVAPTVAAGLFGTSSAQETYQKLIDQGISEQDAVSAARRVGLVQGPLEGVATAVGLGAFRAAKPLVGLGGTTAGVAARMTDSAVLKPFAKGMAANLAVQPATEVAQDVGTAKIEEAYGGKPEDIAAIARQSALGGVGLTLLLGPLAMGGHVARANRAEKLKEALYSPETPTEIRAQALDLVMGEARRQNIPEAGVDQWFEQQLAMEDARNAELAKLEAETKAGERDLLITEEEPLQQRIDQKLGLTRTEDRKNYAKQFEAAFTEGTGQRVADAVTGIEREVTAGELVQRDLPQDLTVAVAEEAKQPTPSIFSALDTELLKQGVKPTKNSRELYQYMVAENIDPASPEAEPVLNALANSKLGEARKAVGEIIRARSPRGAGISTVSQPAGSVGVGSPVVQGGVGAAGSPVALTGGNAQPAGTTGAPVQQAGVLPVAASQPAAPVTTGAPSGPQASQTIQAAPQGQTAAAVPTAPAEVSQPLAPGQFRRAPRPMTVLESARAVPTPPVAPVAAEPAAPDIIGQIFGEDDADIIRGFLQGRSSTELAAEAKAKGIKGRGEQMIRNKIAGEMAVRNEWPKKIAAAKQKFGYTDAQIQQALEASMAPDADTRSEVERELNLGRANLYGARMSETEAIEAGLEGSVKSAGAGSSAVKGFTKPQKEIDAMYKRLETDKDDPLVMAWVSNRLTELTEKVEQLEDNIQAKIRAVAGVEEADADAEVQQKAEPTKAKAESKKAKEPAAPVVPVAALDADTKAATDQAKAKWQAANRDLTKLNVADLNLLRNNALRLRNTALAESIAQEIQAQGGETNAVQVESAAEVPVREGAKAGKGVGKQVRGAKKPAGESQVLTEAEQAGQAWDKVAADYHTAPKFADLTDEQRQDFIDFGPENWTKSDVETELTKLAKSGMKFGKEGAPAREPYTAKQLLAELKAFIRSDIPGRKLMIVDSVADLLSSGDKNIRAVGAALQLQGAYGVAVDGRAFLVANRIKQGSGRAKFMHEVGGHLGLDNLLTKADQDKLVNQIKAWAKGADGSLESELALQAFERVQAAQTPVEDRRSELIAYFIESAVEMGVDPTAATDAKLSGPLRNWFRTLWAAFKVAARKLGMKPESMTAQDVVNLAYGAARLEINGTWHGTAAAFRNFRNKFIGSGEGATAYGWGTYLAQRTGIAKGYWKADVERKGGAAEGNLMRVDTAIQDDRVFDYDKPVIAQSNYVADKLMALLDPVTDDIVDRTNKDVEELTGKDLIGSGENDLGLLSQLIMDDAISLPAGQDKQFDEAVRQGKFHEAASHLLRGIGLDGIKFYDAKSRGSATNAISFEGRRYNRDDLRDQVRKYRDSDNDKAMQFLILGDVLRNGLAETKQALAEKVAEYEQRFFDTDKESAARYNVKFDEDKALADAKALAQRTVYQAKQLAWLNANEKEISLVQNQKMRNLIVFDDKNIFRVGAEAAADRQRMKFGKSAEQINRAVSKLPKQAQKPVSNSVNTIADWARQGLDRVVFTGDLINRAVDAGLTAAKKFEGLLAKRSTKARELEREVERIADMYAVIAEKDKGTGPNSANQFIFDSTRTGKWGYGKYADPAMAARFNALAPKTQEFVKAVFAHGDKMLSAKKATVLKYATSEYDGRIAMEKDPVKKAALLKDKANDLKKFARLFQIREGIPYAPIKRFGAHVVIAKSDAYIAAKAANDTKLLSQLEKDPDHYHVSFTDTKNEARNLVSQLETQGFFAGGTVAFKERSTAEKELFGNSDSLGAITRLRAMADAKANAGEKSAAQMQRMISDLYLQALAEGSARKSEMRRRGVAGEVDMLRSFAAQGRADANFIASVEYNPQVQDAIQEMRSQENSGSGDLNRKSELLNELTKRYESSLDVTATPTLSKITRLSSIYYLATSPAYYLQNLTQPWMMSLPAMSGRHDYTKASGELFKAYGQLSGVMKSAKLFDQQFDFSKVPADVRAAIQELANRGKIDIGMETELGEFKVEGDSALSKGWNKVDKGMRVAVQKVESINRLSTAMAAYRLELAKTGKVEDAINYADRILTETHGDYTAFNAPRFFNNPVGKIALQFRKFQLIQLTYYAKLINEAFTGTEKKAAIKALTYSLGHTALLAGAMGLPGYSAIAWLIGALFGDDDEPLDVTQELRKWIGDETTANLIMRGAPTLAGMDISGKVGAGNMLSIMPFSQADLTTRAGVIEAAGTLLGGAPVGMAARVADGLGLMLGGNWYKGMEQVLPKGLGDAAKAYRIATEGVTRRNGDIVLPASEVSAAEAIMQAIGIQPVQQSVIMERQQATREMDQSFQDRSTRVKADYIKAVRAGESTTEARAAWTKLQEARVNNGYTRQPLSELLKAPQNQAKRERQTKEGVQFNKANKRFVEGQV